MFSLSRVLPDSSLRPISAGMISRPEDTVACEVLPGERAAIFFDDGSVAVALGLDEHSVLQYQADGSVAVALLREADPILVFVHRAQESDTPVEFARIKHVRYDADDIRAFVQVFPIPQSVALVPAG